MNVTCSAPVCPVILNSSCVFYEGESLVYTGINTNDSLQVALQKIDAALGLTTVVNIYNSDGVLTGNRNVFMNNFTLSFEKDVFIYNARVGRGAGAVVTNTVLGNSALNANTTGQYNTAVGISTLNLNTTGNYNTALGAYSLSNATTAEGNTGVGTSAMTFLTTGYSNTAVGFGALYKVVGGYQNVGVGRSALYELTSGNQNIGIGLSAGSSITTGSKNTIIGWGSGQSVSTGSSNTIIGANVSGLASTTSNNIILSDGDGNVQFKDDGANTILPRLAGVGTRMVVAGATGALSSQTIPTGNITGTGANGQVAYWTGASTQAGSNNLFYDAANARLGIGTNAPAGQLDVVSDGGGQMFFSRYGGQPQINIRRAQGTFAVPTAVVSGASSVLNFQNYNGTAFQTSAQIQSVPTTQSATDAGATLALNVVQGLTTTMTNGLIVSGNNTSAGAISITNAFNAPSSRLTIWQSTLNTTLDYFDIIATGGAQLLRFWNSGNLTVGSGADATYRLDVNGTSRFQSNVLIKGSTSNSTASALTVQNSSNANMLTLRNDGVYTLHAPSTNLSLMFNGTDAQISRNVSGTHGLSLYGPSNASHSLDISSFNSGNYSDGALSSLRFSGNYISSAGSTAFSYILINGTINQTGSTSITRGLYINPTLTLAPDWRAIEVALGITVLAPSTTSSASLRLPNGVAPTTPTNGDIWSTTTDLLARINGVTYSLINSGLSGSGAAGQVTFWSSATNITGSNNLFWDNGNSRLGIGTTPATTLDVTATNPSTTAILTHIATVGNSSTKEVLRLSAYPTTFPPANGFGVAQSFYSVVAQATNSVGEVGRFDISVVVGTPTSVASRRFDFKIKGNVNTDPLYNAFSFITSTTAGVGRFEIPTSNLIVGNTGDGGQRLQVYGTALFTGTVTGTGNSSTYSVTASGGIARSSSIAPTLIATANNDVLAALDITPTFTTGAFTGLSTLGLRVNLANTLLQGSGNDASTFALTVLSSGATLLRVRNDQKLLIGGASTTSAPVIYAYTGIVGDRSLRIGIQSAGSLTPTPAFNINQENDYTYTSGTGEFTTITANFLPTSGNGTLAYLTLKGTINQVGATGVTRGLYINPTLTAAADWRAIETSAGGAYINTTAVNASAILQADSTTKGFLPPRMTVAQRTAIVSPAEGLIVFQTDGTIGLYVYANATWRSLTMV